MTQGEEIQKALRMEIDGPIYRRGEAYYRRGRVRGWDESEDADGSVRITGDVRGARLYHVSVVYDPVAAAFLDFTCTCPYGYGCKHVAALVLAYLDKHEEGTAHRAEPRTTQHTPKDDAVRTVLATLGLNADAVPDTLINELLAFCNSAPSAKGTSAMERTGAATKKPLNLSSYAILLHAHRQYAPSFHKKGVYYERASIAPLLKDKLMTDDERALLTYIKEHDGFQYRSDLPESDPSVLFPLLAKVPIMVVCKVDYYNTRQMTIDVDPKPLAVSLTHRELVSQDEGVPSRSVIDLVLADTHAQLDGTVSSDTWSRHGARVVRRTDAQLRLYTLTPEWAALMSRTGAVFDHEVSEGETVDPYWYSRSGIHHHGTVLTGKEIEQLRSLIASVPAQVALTVSEEVRTLVLHTKKPTPAFMVDFSADEHVLRVIPAVRYDDVYTAYLTDTISRRHTGRVRYVRRDTPWHGTAYRMVKLDGTLHYVRLHPNEEIARYKELEEKHDTLGFTKTLRSLHRGARATARYLAEVWPALSEFAERKGYEVIFARDALPRERVHFSADFTSDVDADNDWLHFDVELYCAGEKVTLERLYEFMASGDTYFRKADGTLVEVENRAELERLVRLLKSFHAREEGGFEGKLHHAPELSYVMTSSPHYSAAQNKSLRTFMKRVESGKPLKAVRLPKRIQEVLRPYQRIGVDWLYFLRSYRFAGILADDMGLGKTLQALTVLARERVAGVPSLVVCPKTLLYNWKNEAAAFFPKLAVLVYEGAPEEREALRDTFTKYDLVVVSYHTLKRDADVLNAPGRHYNYAVLDEAQYIKNHRTHLAQTVKEIPADYRLALTGTPLENHVFEVWSIYDYLMPGFLGGHDHFAEHFHKPIMEAGDQDALMHLRKKVESFMLRRSKAEVLKELPPKVEQVTECTLSAAQNVLYQEILSDVRGTVFGAVEKKGYKGAQIHILAGLTKLRQACNHPALLTKDTDYAAYESAKLDACLELIDDVAQANRKVLVFSQFTGMLDILAQALEARGTAYAYLSGKTRKRQEVIERFSNDADVPVFLISMKAGGTGLNLTAADTVIIFDPWWNPSVENQAVDRAHRIGQTQSVNVYRLLTKGTIEDKIQALKHKKQNLFNAIIEESGDLFTKLTWDDIRELFAE